MPNSIGDSTKNINTTLDNIAPIPDKQGNLIDTIKSKQQLIDSPDHKKGKHRRENKTVGYA